MRGIIAPSVYVVLIATSLFFTLQGEPALAQRTKTSQRAGEQVKAERGLKDNRYFFYFIDSSISNFGGDEERKLFIEAIRRDILAQLLFMRFQFKEAYAEVRNSQRLLVELYGITLRRDIGMTKGLLDELAPVVIDSKDAKGRAYLWLGYRDMKSAQTNLVMGDNFREPLYSMRLYQYVKAIKLAKHGKRFALLSIIEASTPPEKKKNLSRLPFEEIDKRLGDIPAKDRIDHYRLVHRDNYYAVGSGKSVFDTVWENPAMQELEDYQRYLKDENY